MVAYSDASAEWGNGVEGIIENTFRRFFRTYIVSGRVITVRMPFAQDDERSELTDEELTVEGGGKADPLLLWGKIDEALGSDDFRSYASSLEDGREKIMVFDLQQRNWSVRRNWYEIASMKAGLYLGLPHVINVLVDGRELTAPDIYNYLYSVSRVGMDCSGFVWSVLKAVAKAGGLDLDRAFIRYLGAPDAASVPLYVGAWFFDPRNRNLEEIKDEPRNLKPGDVITFRGEDGTIHHSAVIQSVDLAAGKIRYLQSTDEAPQDERGVHDSIISFDPGKADVSLKDPSVQWLQKSAPPFYGEINGGNHNDGERYRAHPEFGGGTVVRVKVLKPVIDKLRSAKPTM
jgi:hypothetical protein